MSSVIYHVNGYLSGNQEKKMIIDAHNHPDWHGHDFRKFLANMERYSIDITWLLTWECPSNEYDAGYTRAIFPPNNRDTAIPFERCLSYSQRAPGKFILGYAPDPRKPHAIAQLEAAIEIYGVKVFGELKLRMMYDNLDAIRMFRFCGKRQLPVIVHLDYSFEAPPGSLRPDWWYGGGIEVLERAIIACPDTVFLGHAPGFWSHISGDDQYDKVGYPSGKVVPGGKLVAMLRKYPNLYCDLSANSGLNALKRDPEFAKEFLIEFQDRILYGRDYFDNAHQEFLNSLGLAQEVLDKIYSKNACKLVPLS
jgi:predicted TIM-barrel fold metal-dependent hydrolase